MSVGARSKKTCFDKSLLDCVCKVTDREETRETEQMRTDRGCSNPAVNFPWQKLPAEIQLKILEVAVQDHPARVHILEALLNDQAIAPQSFQTDCTNPTLLRLCYDSRKKALQRFKCSVYTRNRRTVEQNGLLYFDGTRDILYIREFRNMMPNFYELLLENAPPSIWKWTQGIQNLAIDVNDLTSMRMKREARNGGTYFVPVYQPPDMIVRVLRMFPDLESVKVVVRGPEVDSQDHPLVFAANVPWAAMVKYKLHDILHCSLMREVWDEVKEGLGIKLEFVHGAEMLGKETWVQGTGEMDQWLVLKE